MAFWIILLIIAVVIFIAACASGANGDSSQTTSSDGTPAQGRRIGKHELPQWMEQWQAAAEQDYEVFLQKYAATYEEEEAAKREVAANTEEVRMLRERIESEVQGNLFSERYYLQATSDMLYLTLLAQKQKLPRKVATGGLQYGNENWRSVRSFIVWYGEELQACGFPYELLYISGMTVNVMISESAGNLPQKAREALHGPMGFFYWHPNRGQAGRIGSPAYIIDTGYENHRRWDDIRIKATAYDKQRATEAGGNIETSAFRPDEVINKKWAAMQTPQD